MNYGGITVPFVLVLFAFFVKDSGLWTKLKRIISVKRIILLTALHDQSLK
jgi:hypothetical protein